jgi:methyltransferase-like protein/2-polyprenyl-3-methyl-5-hydroxy-6-metoxy-1,4-benzoquinol methylase
MAQAARKKKAGNKSGNNVKAETRKSAEAYDEVPYESSPFPDTQPAHLCTVARLFGLKTPDPAHSRVLELGSASGGNLLPLAIDYPDSEFVGIDISPVQINEGKRQAAELELDNLTLEATDIMQFDQSRGQFDYIICHGVFTWVPDKVRDKILKICRDHLTDNGVAVISYNVLPAWAAVRSVRDMLIYHCKTFEDPAQKVQQARLLIDFLYNNTIPDSPYQGILEQERRILLNAPDHYILHEYLEDVNTPFYLHEFVERANARGLGYLGDSDIQSMYAGNMPDDAKRLLHTMNDIVRQEQYMDFIRNRRFRKSLITREGKTLDYNIGPDKVDEFYIIADIRSSGTPTLDREVMSFDVNTGGQTRNMQLSDPYTKGFMATLAHYSGVPVDVETLVQKTQAAYQFEDEDHLRKLARNSALEMVLRGFVTPTVEPGQWADRLSDYPRVHPLALYQARDLQQKWITTAARKRYNLDDLTRDVTAMCDGAHSVEDIVQHMIERLRAEDRTIYDDNKEEITEPEAFDAHLDTKIREFLVQLRDNRALVA